MCTEILLSAHFMPLNYRNMRIKPFFALFLIILVVDIGQLRAQSMLKIGLGFIKISPNEQFYAPIIVQNEYFEEIDLYEGEPIISLDGTDLRVFQDLITDSLAYLEQTAVLRALLDNCTECKFTTLQPVDGSERSWVGYNGIFELTREFEHPYERLSFKANLGYTGMAYQLQLKAGTKFVYAPYVTEVKKGSPAELAGVKVGDELSRIVWGNEGINATYNTPLVWLHQKLQGEIGTQAVVYLNENQKKTMTRANLLGTEIANAQVVANCFSGDCLNGSGVLVTDKERYEGKFVNGKYQGDGKIYKNDMLVFVGKFNNGKKHGTGIEYRSDGTQVECIYTNGRSGNNFKYTMPNGFVYHEFWQGEMKSYYDAKMNPIAFSDVVEGKTSKTPTQDNALAAKSIVASRNTKVVAAPNYRAASPPPTTDKAVYAKTEHVKATQTPVQPITPKSGNATSGITKPAPAPASTSAAAVPTDIHKQVDSNKITAESAVCGVCKGSKYYAPLERCGAEGCVHGNVKCQTCRGTGKVKNPQGKEVACDQCKYISEFMPHGHSCKTCKGTGMVRGKSDLCVFCKGTGKKLK